MTRSLICEGACNPHCQSVDTEVRDWRKRFATVSQGKSIPVTPYLADRLLTLRHTPHEVMTDEQAICQQCGYQRRHGMTTSVRVWSLEYKAYAERLAQ